MLRPLLLPLIGTLVLLSGCLYDNPPSGPSGSIDTWLVGQWEATDKAGHHYKAVMSAPSSDHYHLAFFRPGAGTMEFDGWISRVDGFSILTLKSLNQGPTLGKHALYHYELLSPGSPPPGGIGATRIRLSELQLDPSAATLDSYHLRRDIRDALKAGTLLAPYDVATDRKADASEASQMPLGTDLSRPEVKIAKPSTQRADVPGSVIWAKTGGVTLSGETF